MISLLDEEGRVPKGTDKGFVERVDKLHAKNQFYERKPQQKVWSW
jgi:myosin heavy subunit